MHRDAGRTKTGYVVIGKLKRRAAADLNTRLERLVRRHPSRVRTCAADDGTELHSDKLLEARLPLKFYFATPHHSWERGSNENMNGLIRRYLPITGSMAHLNPSRVQSNRGRAQSPRAQATRPTNPKGVLG